MQLICIFMLCVVLIAQGQVISIRHIVFNLYFGSREDHKKNATMIPAAAEMEVAADAAMLPDDSYLNEIGGYDNLKKCVMSYCVAYCRKMGYHRGVCILPDTCDCYN
ncbi:unnamed protein product [Arctia plantaginis]|uniref:Defensin n=1 Tax=Arctia plantaginis TaxID=874455 RepID=A0A8S1BF86_ARCPL|nr:unnamed protein product [Arctia plantaginis]